MPRRIYGLHAARAALEYTPEKLVSAWVDLHRQDGSLGKIVQRLSELGVRVHPADKRQLEKLSGCNNHQGVVFEIELPEELGEDHLKEAVESATPCPLYLVLDHVQDPHNLGACLRTADAAGVKGVIVTKDQSAGLSPAVYKVACGAAETVPLYRVTNLARTLRWMKAQGIWVIGAAGEAPRSLYDTDLTLPLALVIGAEGKGLRRLTREQCDLLVSLPMLGQVESLNLSVAAGILLYEIIRQRLR